MTSRYASASAVGLLLVVLGVSLAQDDGNASEVIIVDDFESGTLGGWSVESSGAGNWFVYQDGATSPDPSLANADPVFNVPNPPEGLFAAVTDTNSPGTRILYRDLDLSGRYELHMTIFYDNGAGPSCRGSFASPDSLSHSNRVGTNQQFRIDLLAPTAPIDTVADGEVLATIFRTAPDDPVRLEPTAISFDLSAWEGQAVRLRFANVDNRCPFRVGVDSVRLEPLVR